MHYRDVNSCNHKFLTQTFGVPRWISLGGGNQSGAWGKKVFDDPSNQDWTEAKTAGYAGVSIDFEECEKSDTTTDFGQAFTKLFTAILDAGLKININWSGTGPY